MEIIRIDLCRFVGVVIGWIVFAYLTYRVATVKIEVEVWDPYEVLGISEVNVQLIIKRK